jgi:hypothetical protein
MTNQADELIVRLDKARGQLSALLPSIEPYQDNEIYPGWTIKEMLAHITGWDDLVIAFLDAFMKEEQPQTPSYRMIDEYNQETVSTRAPLDFEQTFREWISTRENLKNRLKDMPAERFSKSFLLPWGDPGTIQDLLEVFIHHEHQHADHIGEWLKDVSTPMVGKH